MAVLSLVQWKVAPGDPVKETVTDSPEQAVSDSKESTVGRGRTVKSKTTEGPVQVPTLGVTTIVLTCGALTWAAVKVMVSPLPEAASPVAVLLLVQEKEAPKEPLKAILRSSRLHTCTSGSGLAVGAGLTIMSKETEGPVQPF